MWLTLAAAGLFGIILMTMLLRPERSLANGTVTVIITVLALGIAAAASFRGFGPAAGSASETTASAQPPTNAALPALSCIDDLAGDTVLGACEKALFGSAETAAAAVSYAASQISRLTGIGDVAAVDQSASSELFACTPTLFASTPSVLWRRESESAVFSRRCVSNMPDFIGDSSITCFIPSYHF